MRRSGQPRRQGRPGRVLRRAERVSRGDRGDRSQAAIQTCVVHLIRNALRFASHGDRKAVATALKPVYTAPNAISGFRAELDAFAATELGMKNPNVTRALTGSVQPVPWHSRRRCAG